MPNEHGIIPKFSTILLFGLICQCTKIKVGEGSVRMSFRTRRWHVPSRNHEPSWGKLRFARSLHQSLSQFGQKKYRIMLVPCHETMPSFIQACFGITGIKKPSFSIFPAEPRRPDVWISFSFLPWDLEIQPRTHIWFSNNFGALEHVLVVQIWIMHIKCPETQLMYKNAKRTWNNSKI